MRGILLLLIVGFYPVSGPHAAEEVRHFSMTVINKSLTEKTHLVVGVNYRNTSYQEFEFMVEEITPERPATFQSHQVPFKRINKFTLWLIDIKEEESKDEELSDYMYPVAEFLLKCPFMLTDITFQVEELDIYAFFNYHLPPPFRG